MVVIEPLPDPVPDALDEDAILLEPVEEAVEFRPVVDVELRETNIPPATRDGEVLLPDFVAAALYASSVFREGAILILPSIPFSQPKTR